MTVIPQLLDERLSIDLHLPRPSSISDFVGTFTSAEVDDAAEKLITFFKEGDRWVPFSFAELLAHYEANRWQTEGILYGLLGTFRHQDSTGREHWYRPEHQFVVHDTGSLKVTRAFVLRASKLIRLGAAWDVLSNSTTSAQR